MNRRRYLTLSATTVASGITAGCLGSSSNTAPPRKSDVFQAIRFSDNGLQINFMSDLRIQSRAEVSGGGGNSLIEPPVGVASAKGRGAGGRGGRSGGGYSSAPKRNGRAKWHGGSYAAWHDDHDDEVQWYPATVVGAGIGYFGTNDAYTDSAPGAGAVDWEQQWNSPSNPLSYDASQAGWYRAGTRLQSRNGDHTFGWEAVDFRLRDEGSGMNVEEQWKISPRL